MILPNLKIKDSHNFFNYLLSNVSINHPLTPILVGVSFEDMASTKNLDWRIFGILRKNISVIYAYRPPLLCSLFCFMDKEYFLKIETGSQGFPFHDEVNNYIDTVNEFIKISYF